MLKFMYTLKIEQLPPHAPRTFPYHMFISLYALADKYDVFELLNRTVAMIKGIEQGLDVEQCKWLVEAHYATCVCTDCAMCLAIAAKLLRAQSLLEERSIRDRNGVQKPSGIAELKALLQKCPNLGGRILLSFTMPLSDLR